MSPGQVPNEPRLRTCRRAERFTHLVNDGHFLLLAKIFIHHVHFWRAHHCLSERNDGLRRADLNFSKPLKKKLKSCDMRANYCQY